MKSSQLNVINQNIKLLDFSTQRGIIVLKGFVQMDFGTRIRELRKAKGISLRDFADLVRIDFTYLSKIENGKVDPPSEEKIRSMADKLEVDPEELLGSAGKISSEQIRRAVDANPSVGVLLRKLQSQELTDEQVKGMLDIASSDDKTRNR